MGLGPSVVVTYVVGFDGRWQETFDDREQAIQWALEVSEAGRVVDVVLKRRFLPPKLLTAFPGSERATREAAWCIPWTSGGAQPFGG